LFFSIKMNWFLVVYWALPEKFEYKSLPGTLNAYCPPRPKINPVAGFEPTMGTISSDPAASDLTFGGLCMAFLIRSLRSF